MESLREVEQPLAKRLSGPPIAGGVAFRRMRTWRATAFGHREFAQQGHLRVEIRSSHLDCTKVRFRASNLTWQMSGLGRKGPTALADCRRSASEQWRVVQTHRTAVWMPPEFQSRAWRCPLHSETRRRRRAHFEAQPNVIELVRDARTRARPMSAMQRPLSSGRLLRPVGTPVEGRACAALEHSYGGLFAEPMR